MINLALKPEDLALILAIAGRIDAQSRIVAQNLEKVVMSIMPMQF